MGNMNDVMFCRVCATGRVCATSFPNSKADGSEKATLVILKVLLGMPKEKAQVK